jgi:hypothetical protein
MSSTILYSLSSSRLIAICIRNPLPNLAAIKTEIDKADNGSNNTNSSFLSP